MISHLTNTVATRFSSLIINFILVILSTQLLGAEGRGVIGLFIAYYSLIMLFVQFIGGSPIVYLGKEHPFFNLWLPSLFANLMICLLCIPLLSNFNDLDNAFNIHIAGMAFLHAFWHVNTYLMLSKERVKDNNLCNLFFVSSLLTSFILCFYLNGQVWDYIWALYVANGLTSVISQWLIIKDWGESNINNTPISNSIKALFKNGLIAQLANVLQFLNYRITYFILGQFVLISDIGIYSACVQLCEALWVIAKSFSTVLYARISNEKDKSTQVKLSLILAKTSLMLTFIMSVVLITIPEIVFAMIFGEEFITLGITLKYLLPGIIAFGFSILLSAYFSGNGQFHINSTASLIGFIAIIPIAYLLIPKYGIQGAAMASSFSFITSTIYLVWKFLKVSKLTLKELWPKLSEIRQVLNLFKNHLFGASQAQ